MITIATGLYLALSNPMRHFLAPVLNLLVPPRCLACGAQILVLSSFSVLATGKVIKDNIGSRGNPGLLKAEQVILEMPGNEGWHLYDTPLWHPLISQGAY